MDENENQNQNQNQTNAISGVRNKVIDALITFASHDGSSVAVNISDTGINFSPSGHKLSTQEIIFVAKISDILRDWFNYKYSLIAKQRGNTQEVLEDNPVVM